MESPPLKNQPVDQGGMVSRTWSVWMTQLWVLASSLDDSGATASRPTKGLYVGRTFFDTTLGRPIWLESVRPTVWVDATGTPV